MSRSAQYQAKAQLELGGPGFGFGFSIWDIPGVNGIGIVEGAVMVSTEYYHQSRDMIPEELTASFEGLPVIVVELAEPEHLQREDNKDKVRVDQFKVGFSLLAENWNLFCCTSR